MSHESAIHAACNSILKGELSLGGFPLSQRGKQCIVQPVARDKKAAVYYGWSATADGFWCLTGHFIDFEFSEKDGRLARIAAYCHPIDP
jgi:hypothetical protein